MIRIRATISLIEEARDAIRRYILDDNELYRPSSISDKRRIIVTCKELSYKFRIRITSSKKGVKVTKMIPYSCIPAIYYKSKPA